MERPPCFERVSQRSAESALALINNCPVPLFGEAGIRLRSEDQFGRVYTQYFVRNCGQIFELAASAGLDADTPRNASAVAAAMTLLKPDQ
jgi:hypothetical protein